jgi:hypothetical protein
MAYEVNASDPANWPGEPEMASHFAIRVERRGDQWAVTRGGGRYLNEPGGWIYTRSVPTFSLDVALELAKQAAPHVTVNGWTVTGERKATQR